MATSLSIEEMRGLPCPEHGLEPPYTHAVLYVIGRDKDKKPIEEWSCIFCGRQWPYDDSVSQA